MINTFTGIEIEAKNLRESKKSTTTNSTAS